MNRLYAAITAGFLATAFVGVALALAVDEADEERTFVDWARRSAIPLKTSQAGAGFEDLVPLGAAVGDAKVVALGESTHGTREVFQMKHRLLEYLVERKGFNVFAIEGSPGGCAAIDAYVHGADGDPAELLRDMGYWTWDTEEVLVLIRWMRAYNDDARHARKVAFHGFDMQSPEDSIQHVLDYLEPFDPALAARVGTDLETYQAQFYWLLYRPLPVPMREALDRATADLKRRLDEGRDELVARSSRKAWEFARRQLAVVEQADEQGRNAMKYQPAMGSVAYRRLVDGLPKTAESLSAALAANDPGGPPVDQGIPRQARRRGRPVPQGLSRESQGGRPVSTLGGDGEGTRGAARLREGRLARALVGLGMGEGQAGRRGRGRCSPGGRADLGSPERQAERPRPLHGGERRVAPRS